MSRLLRPLFLLALGSVAVAVFAYGAYPAELSSLFETPCEEPVAYRVGVVDPRFSVSEEELLELLAEAAVVWNSAAGKPVIIFAADGEVPVHLVYDERQQAAELGQEIDAEQTAYERKRKEVEALRDEFADERRAYERAAATLAARSATYEEDVAYWNARGGAPEAEYRKLAATRTELEAMRREVNAQAAEVNSYVSRLNALVGELNALAEDTNQKVNTYNAAAGTDFDQGNYVEDSGGKRINIYEFTSREKLSRVLAHEFGHALGIGHVENPDSIMYSYSLEGSLALSAQDIAALREVCELE